MWACLALYAGLATLSLTWVMHSPNALRTLCTPAIRASTPTLLRDGLAREATYRLKSEANVQEVPSRSLPLPRSPPGRSPELAWPEPESLGRETPNAAPPATAALRPANFTLAIMWNHEIKEEQRVFLDRMYGRFFAKVVHVGGSQPCNRWNVPWTTLRVAHYTCYGALMTKEPKAFGTRGFLFLADDAVVCPRETIRLLEKHASVPLLAHETLSRHFGGEWGAGAMSGQRVVPLDHVSNGADHSAWANGTGEWRRWMWSRDFPKTRKRLFEEDGIVSRAKKRLLAARLRKWCGEGTRACIPAPALTDILYVPAGPNARAFAHHAAAISRLKLSTELVTPMIMYMLPDPDAPVIPRKALLKNSGKVGSASETIMKKEYSRYAPLNNASQVVLSRDRPTSIRFVVGADALLDSRASFVKFRMRTNTFTAVMPSVHAMVSTLTCRLPSAGNLVIERIENYHSLAIATAVLHSSADQLEASWNDGLSNVNHPS